MAWHRVAADDRLDLVAHRHLGDPQAWWRICDANAALDPDALVGPDAEGRVIVVRRPRGVTMALPGLRLTVLAGPTVPTPLPEPVLSRLRSVKVTETDERALGVHASPSTRGGRARWRPSTTRCWPTRRCARRPRRARRHAGRGPHGAVRRHRHRDRSSPPATGPGSATFDVTGEDVSYLLDREERDVEYPALDDYLQVLAILAPYAAQGILPAAVPAARDGPAAADRAGAHAADDGPASPGRARGPHGYVAYVVPGPVPGVSTFYWGPPVRVGLPQPALSVDLGAQTNVGRRRRSGPTPSPRRR